MPSKDNMEPKRRKWYKFLSGHRAASPAPATAQSVDTGCSGQRHTEHGSNTPSVIAAQSCVPPPSSVADALGARPGAGTDMITSRSVPPVQPVEPTNEPAAAELAEQPRPAISVSERLWNIAYERLETADPELVGLYMKTLEKVLGGETGELCTADISAKLKDPTMRQKHMMELVQNGREKIFKASRITTGVGDVADFILSLKRMVDTVLQSVPQAAPAALPWAGVCLGLEILRNPAQATRSNLAGISHVISRMDWYCALSHHLLNRNKIAADDYEAVLRQLEERVVELYQALLLYQMKSVCSYYRNQGLVFLRGMFSLDDWDGDLGLVSNAEAAVQADAAQYSQELTKAYLAGLSDSAEEMEKRLGDIHQDIRDFISWQKDIRREDIESACRRDLRVIDPQNDMERIERSKDELLNDAFKWILRTPKFAAFTNWDDNGPECHARRLLWIKGHAGTGKTMLMIGLIRQLSCQPVTLAPGLSFFFCQGTDTTLNNATAVLRSLIWLLLYQQPYLVSHLIQKYKDSGTNLFTDKNAFIALSEAFRNMLKDAQLSPVYLAVDALDECTHGLRDLIRLIATSLTLSPKVKWLLSSRPEVINLLTELRGSGASFLNVSDGLLELDTQCLTEPVDAYIRHKLAGLRNRSGYNETVLAEVSDEVHARAGNTFLWVALAFKELDKAHGGYATQKIKGMPSGLTDLYGHMMDRIENGEMIDHEDCERALVAAYLAFRPLSLSELTVLAELQPDITKAAVEACGSFFTITGETVSLIHQSAKDFLEKNFTLKLQPDGVPQGHADISKRSVDAMSLLLKQNIYNIEPGCEPNDKTPPHLDPLASIRYSCEFWANHLLKGENPNKFLRELTDNGKLFVFLKEHLLHWLEALSLMGKTSDGILSIRKLLHAVQLQPNTAPGLMGFLKDAEKFMLSHRSVIERAPLQIYGSALVFSPTSSEVRKQYWKERLPFIRSTAGIRDGWGAQQQTLEGHNGWVTAIAFSPDGKVIASGSYDCTIRLWDTATGVYQQTLEGHNDWA